MLFRSLPFPEGMKRERELFMQLVSGVQSQAQRHIFFAERRAAKIPGVPDDLPAVVTDPGLLERVLVNLLANAQRFSPPDRPPLVRAAATLQPPRLVVEVVDHGPGIRAGDEQRMFRPFQRLGDSDNATGVGLGLAVARGLADAVGGELAPGPTPGGGLTMRLTLPVEEIS